MGVLGVALKRHAYHADGVTSEVFERFLPLALLFGVPLQGRGFRF
jgi:hypothetical protein